MPTNPKASPAPVTTLTVTQLGSTIKATFAATKGFTTHLDAQNRLVVQLGTNPPTIFPDATVPLTITSSLAHQCGPKPPDETRTQQCPAGSRGSWTQTRSYVSAPYPDCWTPGPWLPADPPAGACTIDPPPPPGNLEIDLGYVETTSPYYAQFISRADRDDASVEDLVYAFNLSGDVNYRERALSLVDLAVQSAEADIAAGRDPDVASDSYLYVDGHICDVALAIRYCQPSASQRSRFIAYGDQAIYNVWHHDDAQWGGRDAPWSGWATSDPQNNYYYHFLRATTYWALATANAQLIADLENEHWPLVVDAMADIQGGGSLEGTGYGYSQGNLYLARQVYEDSGYGGLNAMDTQMANSIRYWVYATMPDLDAYMPIGDQARVSYPSLYDYQRALVLRARLMTLDMNAVAMADWWLTRVPDFDNRDNYIDGLMPFANSNSAPSSLTYRAAETGMMTARTAWTFDATALHVLMGRFEQSHAHREQGGFTLFGGGKFLAVTGNIWSKSGIHQTSQDKNIPRFVRGGVTKEQDWAQPANVVYSPSGANLHVSGDLSPLYQVEDNMGVQHWDRTFDFVDGKTTITDNCTLTGGTTATWQCCVPGSATVSGNTVTTSDGMKMTVLEPAGATISVVSMPAVYGSGDDGYRSGNRIEFPFSTRAKVLLEKLP